MNEANANGKANETHAKASQERMVRVSEKASLSTDDKRTASLDAHQTGLVNKIGSFITSKQLTNRESTLMNTTNQTLVKQFKLSPYQTYKRDSKQLARILDTILTEGRMDTVQIGIHRVRIDHTRTDGLISIDLI